MSVEIEDIYLQKSELDKLQFVPKEALHRLKVSRGYYASFLYARELFGSNASYKLQQYEESPDGTPYGSHQKLYESLIRSDVRNLKYIGKTLKKYHVLRKTSDYKLSAKITDYDLMLAERHLKECKERIEFFLAYGDIEFTASNQA